MLPLFNLHGLLLPSFQQLEKVRPLGVSILESCFDSESLKPQRLLGRT